MNNAFNLCCVHQYGSKFFVFLKARPVLVLANSKHYVILHHVHIAMHIVLNTDKTSTVLKIRGLLREIVEITIT